MKAYKFRSAAQIAFAFDIIINKRLYCSEWINLNDPMEGMFEYSYESKPGFDVAKRVMGIKEAKRKYKICSLSATYDSHLLWAHYAGGFDGVAIEIELPAKNPNIKKVEPRGVFASVNLKNALDEKEVAKTILFSKYDVWSYEKEIRILNDETFYKLRKPVKRVIAGHRMPEALFQILNITCNSLGIPFNKIRIGGPGLDLDKVPAPKRLKKNGS
jgi:hypothetical protein